MGKKDIKLDTKIIFWFGMLAIGIGALVAGSVLLVLRSNNLMWLIISFGIILTIVGGLFAIYLVVNKHRQKTVRSKGF